MHSMITEKKKLCFIIGAFPEKSETFITNQIINAIDEGFDVKISVKKLNSLKNTTQKSLFERYEILRRIHIREINISKNLILRFIHSLWLLFLNLREYKVFFKIFRQQKKDKIRRWLRYVNFRPLMNSDVFHVQFADNGLFLVDYKQENYLKTSTNIVVTFHGYDAHYNNNNLQYYQNIYKKLFENSNSVIVNSNYLKNKVMTLGCNKMKLHVIPIGVDCDFFSKKSKPSKTNFEIVSIGRLVSLKGHIYGVKAVENLIQKGYEVNYKIIGDGPLKEELTTYIYNNNLSNNIKLLGWKTQNEINTAFNNSNLFLMTSITDSDNKAEAFGLVTVEAQSTGLPVVAFDSGGVKDTVKANETAFLVKEKDVNELSNKIAYLIDNENVYKTFCLNSREFAKQNFDSKIISGKHLKLYTHD